MEKSNLQSVYIIHQRPFRNTSLLLDAFSKESGRISLIARSARGPKSRFRGQLVLFSPLLISWYGRSELKNITQLETQPASLRLTGKPLFCGFYVNELLYRFLQKEDPHEDLFLLYENLLHQLNTAENLEPKLRVFEKKMLDELGYGLSLKYEAASHTLIHADNYYEYKFESGFSVLPGKLDAMNCFSGKALLALAKETIDEVSILKEIKKLMRLVFHYHLDGRPLVSREMMV